MCLVCYWVDAQPAADLPKGGTAARICRWTSELSIAKQVAPHHCNDLHAYVSLDHRRSCSNYSSIISQYDGHDALFIADRVAVSNGSLVITTTYEPTIFNGVHYNMTSGWLDTKGTVNQTGGRFEARMKMPVAEANGAWPAWWLLPVCHAHCLRRTPRSLPASRMVTHSLNCASLSNASSNPQGTCWPIGGEVDIVEIWMGEGHFQHNKPGNPISMASTYHYGYSCGADRNQYNRDSRWFPNTSDTSAPLIDFSSDYHVFGVELNGTALRFYVDGNTSFVYPLPQLCMSDPAIVWDETPYYPWQAMYGIINVAVSANTDVSWWAAGNNATTLVDWVRWYQWQPTSETASVEAGGGPLALRGSHTEE